MKYRLYRRFSYMPPDVLIGAFPTWEEAESMIPGWAYQSDYYIEWERD